MFDYKKSRRSSLTTAIQTNSLPFESESEDVGKMCLVSEDSEAKKCFCFPCAAQGYLATSTCGVAGLFKTVRAAH